jgi:hypothetical protein
MTLLVSFYTSKGIVFAADRAITVRKPGRLERWEKGSKQRKVDKVTQLGLTGGVVGFFGLAVVDAEPMDSWLRRTLDAWPGSRTVADLGVYLRDELNRCVDPGQRTANASGFHIGSFASRDGAVVPVMQYISNINKLTRVRDRQVPPGHGTQHAWTQLTGGGSSPVPRASWRRGRRTSQSSH